MSGPFPLDVTDALLSTTRAVRKRLDLKKAVPRDVILECIGLSQQAPTGSNQQGRGNHGRRNDSELDRDPGSAQIR